MRNSILLILFYISKFSLFAQCYEYTKDSALYVHDLCIQSVNIDSLNKYCGLSWINIKGINVNNDTKAIFKLKYLEGFALSKFNFHHPLNKILKLNELVCAQFFDCEFKNIYHIFSHPKLDRVTIYNSKINNNYFNDLSLNKSKIKELNFENNDFKELPSIFNKLPKLQILNLCCNKILEVIIRDTFYNLKKLVLHNNFIYNFNINAPKLDYIGLSGNCLTRFPDSIELNCPKLEILDLSYNKIRTIYNYEIDTTSNLKEIILIGNPIDIYERKRIIEFFPNIRFIFDETPNRQYDLDCINR